MNTNASQQFYLFHEPIVSAGTGSSDWLPVPFGVSFLRLTLNTSPELLAAQPESYEDILILETIPNSARQHRLALLNPAAGRLLVKGEPVPRAALLREGDEFSLNHGLSLFVSIFRQPRIASPDETLVGRPCPICRIPFSAASRAYHCQCGCGLHSERPEEKPDPLQCLNLTDVCPRCQAPIVKAAGFSFLPEFAYA